MLAKGELSDVIDLDLQAALGKRLLRKPDSAGLKNKYSCGSETG